MPYEGVCDCGDSTRINVNGGCPDHNGIIDYGKELPSRLIERQKEALNILFGIIFELTESLMMIANN